MIELAALGSNPAPTQTGSSMVVSVISRGAERPLKLA